MPILGTLADIRDIFIIIYGTLGIIFFVVGIVVAVIIGMSVKSLIGTVKDMVDTDIKPAVSSVREAAETVRGTTDFVGRTAVQPIAKVYGTMSGVKRGMGVLANLKRSRRA
ncbi:MAG: hypothetical protein AB7P33_12295 [Dehalococcoidia bacterium]